MKCACCSQSSPVVHLSWMGDNGIQHSDLCNQCLNATPAVVDQIGLSLINFLRESQNDSSHDLRICCHESSEFCPSCRYPLKNFAETGRAGCPDCYNYLPQEDLISMLQISNRSLRYRGKIPASAPNLPSSSLNQNGKINSNSTENDINYSLLG